MTSLQTTAIVIARTSFGEADRILRLITPDHGKISAIAKGVRRIKSRSGGHLELFSEVSLGLATGRNLHVVTSARMVWYPHLLAGDYDRLGLAFMTASMIDRLIEENHSQRDIYDVTREMLRALESGGEATVAELWFKLRLLELLGYRPELRRCLGCGQQSGDTSYFFSPQKGGLVCAVCREATATVMPHATVKLWRILSEHDFASASHISGAAALAQLSLPACDAFYEFHLGRSFSANPIGVTS